MKSQENFNFVSDARSVSKTSTAKTACSTPHCANRALPGSGQEQQLQEPRPQPKCSLQITFFQHLIRQVSISLTSIFIYQRLLKTHNLCDQYQTMFLVRLKYSAFKFEYQNKFSPKNLFVFKKIYNLFCTIEATSLTAFHKFSFSW